MKNIAVSTDIIPIGEFKSGIAKWLTNIKNTGKPLIITQNGRPAGVVLSPADYDALVYRQSFIESVSRGLSDAENGNTMDSKQLKIFLSKQRKMAESE